MVPDFRLPLIPIYTKPQCVNLFFIISPIFEIHLYLIFTQILLILTILPILPSLPLHILPFLLERVT